MAPKLVGFALLLAGSCCQPALADVECGGHRAGSCAECPAQHGEAWCHGVCAWDHRSNSCVHRSEFGAAPQKERPKHDTPGKSRKEDDHYFDKVVRTVQGEDLMIREHLARSFSKDFFPPRGQAAACMLHRAWSVEMYFEEMYYGGKNYNAVKERLHHMTMELPTCCVDLQVFPECPRYLKPVFHQFTTALQSSTQEELEDKVAAAFGALTSVPRKILATWSDLPQGYARALKHCEDEEEGCKKEKLISAFSRPGSVSEL